MDGQLTFGKHSLQRTEPLSELDTGVEMKGFLCKCLALPAWVSVPPPSPAPHRALETATGRTGPTRKTLPSSRPGPARKSPLLARCRWGHLARKQKMFPSSKVQASTLGTRVYVSEVREELSRVAAGKPAETHQTPGRGTRAPVSSPDVNSMNIAQRQGKKCWFKSEGTWPVSAHAPTLVESFLKTGRMPPIHGPTPGIRHLVTSLKSLAVSISVSVIYC